MIRQDVRFNQSVYISAVDLSCLVDSLVIQPNVTDAFLVMPNGKHRYTTAIDLE